MRSPGRPLGWRPTIRPCAWFALLATATAQAHVIPFELLAPVGAGNRSDGGVTLQWSDGPDPGGTATVWFYASRRTIAPFEYPRADAGVFIGNAAIADSTNVLRWNGAGLDAGCYQPFAIVSDPMDTNVHVAGGNFTLVDGPNVPPSIWITSHVSQPVAADGTFTLRWMVDDDDASTVTLRRFDPTGAEAIIAQGITMPAGGGQGAYVVDLKPLPARQTVYFHAEVVSADGRRCDAFWPGFLFTTQSYDAGIDAGTDAGTSPDDGGFAPDASADAGPSVAEAPRGCGCGAAHGALLAASLPLSVLIRRRGHRRPSGLGACRDKNSNASRQ